MKIIKLNKYIEEKKEFIEFNAMIWKENYVIYQDISTEEFVFSKIEFNNTIKLFSSNDFSNLLLMLEKFENENYTDEELKEIELMELEKLIDKKFSIRKKLDKLLIKYKENATHK